MTEYSKSNAKSLAIFPKRFMNFLHNEGVGVAGWVGNGQGRGCRKARLWDGRGASPPHPRFLFQSQLLEKAGPSAGKGTERDRPH